MGFFGAFQTLADFVFRREKNSSIPLNNNVVSSGSTAGETISYGNAIFQDTVFSCFRLIKDAIAQLPLKIQISENEFIDEHPILDLMRCPNRYMLESEFKDSLIYSLLIYGQVFIRLLRGESGRVIEMYLEDPTDINVIVNDVKSPQYITSHGESIPHTDMIHFRDITTFEAYGQSRVLLCAKKITLLMASNTQMATIFRDGIDIKYIISPNINKHMGADERKSYREEIKDNFSIRGTGSSFLFMPNTDLKAVKGMTAADADLREIRECLIREIAAIFGIPAYLVGGMGDEKYNNARQKQLSLYRDTYLPIIVKLQEAFTKTLLTGKKKLVFDVKDFLKGDMESQSMVIERLVRSSVLTPNEARAEMGYTAMTQEGSDELVIQSKIQRSTDISTGGGDGVGGGMESNEE